MQQHSTDPDRLAWDEDVARGRELVETNDSSSWELGKLAQGVEVRYGAGDLQKFADAIGINYDTLRDYLAVVARFAGRPANLSMGVLRPISRIDDATRRAELVAQAEREHWTVSRARKAIQQELSAPEPVQPRETQAVGRKVNIGMRGGADPIVKRFTTIADAFMALAEDEERDDSEPEAIARSLTSERREAVEAAVKRASAFVDKWANILNLDVTGEFDEWQGA